MIQFTNQEFKNVKENSERLYYEIKDVYCPYFKEKILFNDAGMDHLKFKYMQTARTPQDQFMRLKLLHLVPNIIRSSGTLQGIKETNHFERVRIHNRTDSILKPVTYYEFIAVVNRLRVKIIIKQIDSGQKFFWSVIPFWKIGRDTKKRVLYDKNSD